MQFEMPEITEREAQTLIKAACDHCCFWLAEARKDRDAGEDDTYNQAYAERLRAEYNAWVNWQRSKWPTQRSDFMINDEGERYGASAPFNEEKGDRWEHNGQRWNIIRNGKIVGKGERHTDL